MRNCKNCGAPQKPGANVCPYCETCYGAEPYNAKWGVLQGEIVGEGLRNGILTPNEARSLLGIRSPSKEAGS